MKVDFRVLHISKYDLKGGASRAAYNSVAGQRRAGIRSEMLVGMKESENEFVHSTSGVKKLAVLAGFALDKLPSLLTWNRTDVRSLHMFGVSATWTERQFRPDIVIAHKVDGILPVREFPRFTVPVIWRLHDMWPVCGTRHYEAEERILRLHPSRWPDHRANRYLESAIYRRKKSIYKRSKRLIICTPSQWLADCVRDSGIFEGHRIETIPNGIDTTSFQPQSQKAARYTLDLPVDRPVILFGAAGGTRDPRKGFDLLLRALKELNTGESAKPHLLVFGDQLPSEMTSIGLSATSVGRINDDGYLAKVYSCADVFVAPSRQENLSLTVLESLACGTPVVAFDVGGMRDMVKHGQNGWLAKPFDIRDLTAQIGTALRISGIERGSIRSFARRTATNTFSIEAEARSMLRLMREVLGITSSCG